MMTTTITMTMTQRPTLEVVHGIGTVSPEPGGVWASVELVQVLQNSATLSALFNLTVKFLGVVDRTQRTAYIWDYYLARLDGDDGHSGTLAITGTRP
jgi:hypothetical protein